MASAECLQPVKVVNDEGSDVVLTQTDEVARVKAAYPNRCRVVCDAGSYSHVVTVQPENLDVTIKIQLTCELTNFFN